MYNGKELNEEFGLNWLDYGARWYDPAVARWHSVDPKAQKYYALSQYNYVANMPTGAVDPNGAEIVIIDNAHARQVMKDLAKLYATKEGRRIIDRLASSKERYQIDGSAKIN